MAEEQLELDLDLPNEEVVEEQHEEVIPEVNEHQERARQMGWRPLEEFDGDKERWVDAKEFILRGELYDRIHQQDRRMRDMQKALQELAEHNKKVEEAGYRRAVQELQAAKRMAIENNDARAIIELDEKLDEVKDQLRESKQTSRQEHVQDIPPEYWDFARDNPWYTKDSAMTVFADAVGQQIGTLNLPPREFFNRVQDAVRKEFAHKFQRPAVKAGAVESGTQSTKAPGKKAYTPTAEEREVAKAFVRAGAFKNADEYYAQLNKIKG